MVPRGGRMVKLRVMMKVVHRDDTKSEQDAYRMTYAVHVCACL